MNKHKKRISHYSANSYFRGKFPAKVIFHEQIQRRCVWHDHDFYELVLIVSGDGFHKTLQRKVPFKSGSLFFLKPGDVHSYQIKDDASLMVNLLIKRDFFENNDNLLELLESIKETNCIAEVDAKSDIYKRLLSNFQQMKEENELSNKFSLQIFEALLRETLYIAARCFYNCAGDDETRQHVELISNYIADNLYKKPQLNEIVKLTDTNASYISRNFKNITGYKFIELVNEHRIQKICDSLANSDDNIDEIYKRSGYKNKVYFHRAFKRITGFSPLQYRKQFNNNRA